MKRILSILIAAGLSVTAAASPPGPPSIGPVDVNVINTPLSVNVANPPLAVEVQQTSTPQSSFFQWGTTTSEIGTQMYDTTLAEDVLLTGVILQTQVAPTAGDTCLVMMSLEPAGGGYFRLASANAVPGNGIAGLYIPLPNLYAATGDTLKIVIGAPASDECYVEARVHGVIAD